MKGAKIGALFLVSLIALAGVGAGYAAWTDRIHIYTRVQTGSVGWRIIDHSATYVWKIYDCTNQPDPSGDCGTEILVDYDHNNWADALAFVNREYSDCTIIPVAQAETVIPTGYDDHYGRMLFNNLFPDIDFKADFFIDYFGTIPAKISSIQVVGDQGVITPYAVWTLKVNGVSYNWNEIFGVQLHAGDTIYLELTIRFPENADLMSMPRTECDIYINIVQWNEYVPP